MKFWAKVIFRGERNAEHLIRAFFKEFNPESSIVIKGKDANVEIVFESKPPLEIVEAISYCDILDFNFGKDSEECSDPQMKMETFEQIKQEEMLAEPEDVVSEDNQGEDKPLEENMPEENEPEIVKEETVSKVEKTKKKRAKVAKKEKEPKKENEEVHLPKLDEFAQKVTNFEGFVNAVATWLEMDKRKEFFVNLAITASEVEKITWKSLVEGLEKKGIPCSQWDKIWTTSQVSEKLKDENVTILPLLKAMTKYNPSYFVNFNNKYLHKENTEQETVVQEEVLNKDTKTESVSEISALEDIFNRVDKTQTVEERVCYVLNSMGLKAKSEAEQLQLFELVNTAVRVEKMTFDIIFLKANIPMEESMSARMNLSTFINDFVKKYDSDKKLKVLDFLKQMQMSIMYADEIERFDDFSD